MLFIFRLLCSAMMPDDMDYSVTGHLRLSFGNVVAWTRNGLHPALRGCRCRIGLCYSAGIDETDFSAYVPPPSPQGGGGLARIYGA